MREQFHLRLTHKIMAIGIVGLVGLLAFGAIYQIGSWSQDASRAIAGNARTISDLNKKLSMEMLEARRAEKDFQLRRDEAYSKSHAELSATIDRDFQQLETFVRSSGIDDISEEIGVAHNGFKKLPERVRDTGASRDQTRPERNIGFVGIATDGSSRYRGKTQGKRQSKADQLDADDAASREGFHAAA